jgi:hypothetical protein
MEEIQGEIVNMPPAPPPTEASHGIPEIGPPDGEGILSLTQPPPGDGACAHAILSEDSSSSDA